MEAVTSASTIEAVTSTSTMEAVTSTTNATATATRSTTTPRHWREAGEGSFELLVSKTLQDTQEELELRRQECMVRLLQEKRDQVIGPALAQRPPVRSYPSFLQRPQTVRLGRQRHDPQPGHKSPHAVTNICPVHEPRSGGARGRS